MFDIEEINDEKYIILIKYEGQNSDAIGLVARKDCYIYKIG